MKDKKSKNTFLSFRVGKETFAASVKKVLEVLQHQYVTEVPNVPEYVEGVINFRGKIIPVVDTRSKFSLIKRSNDDKYVIIVFDVSIEEKNKLIGAMVDSVHDVIALDDKNILDTPELGYNYNTDFILGMLKNEKSFTMVLDIDKVFSKEDVTLPTERLDEALIEQVDK